jgi:predicted glycoside hydrolase/deacetylase ChbG (UPF0249 family)
VNDTPVARSVIVNADDFGQSPGINRGVVRAHEQGIVTSASLMVRWPAAVDAAAYCRARPALSVGLHLDLGEWRFHDGVWTALYRVVPLDDPAAIRREVAAQLAVFEALVGHAPTHLDSHQHVHRTSVVGAVLGEIAATQGLPLRGVIPHVHYCGDFFGQTAEGAPVANAISVTGLLRLLAALPVGMTELACHPAQVVEFETMYRDERRQELEVLCDARVRTALREQAIALCTFHDVPRVGAYAGSGGMA